MENKASLINGTAARAALIAVAILLIFYPVLHGDFLWDDLLYFTGNPLLHDPNRLWKAWFAPGSFIEYYPLEQTIQWVQWRAWGPDTYGYHLTNVLLHFISALLVWRLLAKFGLRWAWVGGLLFAVHPMNVESVAYVSELKSVLSLPPFLLALCAYIDFEEHGRRRDYLVALALFFTAMLCKVAMAAFPFAILLYAWWKRGRLRMEDVKNAAPFFAVSLLLGAITAWAGAHAEHLDSAHLQLLPVGGIFSRIALVGLTISFYFARFFWPVDPLPIYPRWTIDPAPLTACLPWLMAAAVIFLLWRRRKSWGRHALLGLGFFVIMLLPFSGLVTISYMNFTWVMDHFLYFPMIGLIGLVMAGCERVAFQLARPLRIGGAALLGVVLLLLTIQSQDAAANWTDSATLWSYTLDHHPRAWLAHYNFGNALRDRGHFKEAADQYREAVALHPSYPWAHNNLGLALSHFPEQLPQAIVEYREALRLDPHSAEAHNNLANALSQIPESVPEALDEYQTALRERPDFVAAYYNYGVALAKIPGREGEARAQFQEALRRDPNFGPAQGMLEHLSPTPR